MRDKTPIFDAMTDYLQPGAAAGLYWRAGLSVIPLRGKKPAVKSWAVYAERRASEAQIAVWKRQRDFKNVGIVCGAVSGGLVVVDLDGLDAVNAFYDRFPQLTNTLTVRTGSGTGRHLYFWCENTETVRMKGFEIRGEGCYVVAPPSVHPVTGWRYIAQGLSTPMRPARLEVDAVRDWIRSQRPQPDERPLVSGELAKVGAWAQAAQRGELQTLAQAGEGDFNNALYRAALKLGSIVADGLLSREQVMNDLYTTAQQCGYVTRDGSRQTWATINSGINTGLRNPRGRAWS